jgi:hypothetical protein
VDRFRINFIVFAACLFFGCSNPKEEAEVYVKDINKYSIQDVSYKKILVDPSFNYPYNVYIKVSMDSSSLLKLIKDLGLVKSFADDSSSLKRYMPRDEYDLFFKMSSINKRRNSFIKKAEDNMSWWPFNSINSGTVYASAYKDTMKVKKVVPFNEKFNGRLALTTYKSDIYILIECWDW